MAHKRSPAKRRVKKDGKRASRIARPTATADGAGSRTGNKPKTRHPRSTITAEKYRGLFNNLTDGFAFHKIVVDKTGKPVDYIFLEVNSAFEKLTGLKAADIVNKRVTDALPGIENDPADWIGTYGRIALNGGKERFERYAAALNKWYLVTAYSPQYGLFATILEEITDHKRSEDALRHSEEEFRRAIEEAPIPVIMHAEDGEVLQISRTWTALTGYEINEVRTFDEWLTHAVYGEGADEVRDHLRMLFANSSSSGRVDFSVRTKTGETRYWSFSASVPGTLSDGRRFVVGMALDITERKETEQALLESERKFFLLFRKAGFGVALATSSDGVFVDVNEAAEQMLGYSRQEIIGKDSLDLGLHPDPEVRARIFAALAEKGSIRDVETKLRTRSGEERMFLINVILMDLGGRKHHIVTLVDITERKQYEEALSQSTEDLDRAQEVGQIGWWRLNVRKNVLTWSDESYRIFGIPRGTPLTYETFLSKVHPDDREYVDARWNAALKGGDYDIEHRIVVGDQVKWVREKAYLEIDKRSELTGGFGICQDISQRKEAEASLEHLNAELELRVNQRTRFYELLAGINEAIFRNRDRQTLFDEVCRMLVETGGFRLAWIGLANPASRIVPPSASFGAISYLNGLTVIAADVAEGRGPTGRAIREDRHIINLDFETNDQMKPWRERARKHGIRSSSAFPLRVEGDVVGALTIYSEQPHFFTEEEISLLDTLTENLSFALEMIEVDRQMREAELERIRLAAALESAGDAVVITEPAQGRILYVNEAFERITGYTRTEAIGETLHLLDSRKHDASFFEEIRENLHRDNVWQGRLVSRKKDGTLYFEDCTFSTIREPGGNVLNYVSIKRDVTEKLRLESIAESVSMMDNIGAVFAGIRHEIGNPLNNAKIMLSVLQEKNGTLSADRMQHYIERTLSEIGRIEQLLKTLKTFNLFDTPFLDDLDSSRQLNQFRSLVREDLAARGILLTQQVLPGAEHVHADARVLQHVLLNLVTNAADALAGRSEPRIDITFSRASDRVRIRISDNGRGMTDEQAADLFKPFHTTKRHGTGLGLVIVKKMLTAMNGTIDFTTASGSGTVMNVYLPGGNRAEGS